MNRHPTKANSRALTTVRRAYTLIELLVVLGIVTTMLAVAVPALRRPLAKSTVGQAALELRRALAAARLAAVKRGSPARFTFQSGSSSFRILSLNGAEIEPPGELPNGVVFASTGPASPVAIESATAGETPSQVAAEGTPPDGPSATMTDDPFSTIETPPTTRPIAEPPQEIVFFPDGRSQSAVFVLASADYTISVSVRGLVGEVKIDKPVRVQTPLADVSTTGTVPLETMNLAE